MNERTKKAIKIQMTQNCRCLDFFGTLSADVCGAASMQTSERVSVCHFSLCSKCRVSRHNLMVNWASINTQIFFGTCVVVTVYGGAHTKYVSMAMELAATMPSARSIWIVSAERYNNNNNNRVCSISVSGPQHSRAVAKLIDVHLRLFRLSYDMLYANAVAVVVVSSRTKSLFLRSRKKISGN